jgi:ribonuclease BN (tRNA processing enzyme)
MLFGEIYMLNSKGSYSKGTKVFWKWGRGKIKGTVKEVYFHTIEKEIKGSRIKRKANAENPAYFIKEDNKDKYVLKLHSELLD